MGENSPNLVTLTTAHTAKRARQTQIWPFVFNATAVTYKREL
jgi:hypothetical protein